MDAERIMERVRRLLAIANDPAASDNEQRIALEQAQRLMDRHAIEEWQLEEDHDAIEIIRRMIHLEANPCNWYMAELANIVALTRARRAVTRRISLMESPLTDEELLLLDGWSPTPTALWRLKARGSID